MYCHGVNVRTCPQARSAAPTASPASRTSGVRPRVVRCAAAARPTGPAPMTTTGRPVGAAEMGVELVTEILRVGSSGQAGVQQAVGVPQRARAARRAIGASSRSSVACASASSSVAELVTVGLLHSPAGGPAGRLGPVRYIDECRYDTVQE